MTVNEQIPDYHLDEMVVVTAPEQLRALADPLRATLLELLLERAVTIPRWRRRSTPPRAASPATCMGHLVAGWAAGQTSHDCPHSAEPTSAA